MPRPHTPEPRAAAGRSRHPQPARRRWRTGAPFCVAWLAAALVAGCGGDGDDAAVLNADADSATMPWNTSVTVDVLANDSSNDGPVTVASVAEPEHGTAAMVDGRLVYTPEPGWFGVETVTYTASGAGIQVAVPVRIAVQARMTLAGTVADAPLARAAVKVAVGDDEFGTTTDADGRYRVEVTADAQADVVRIEATGTGMQATVRLVGYAGTAGAVAEDIDAAGVVSAADEPGLDVSHVSTAIAALISRGKDGAPKTGEALDAALATVSPEAALMVATLLQQVIDHGQPLPAGHADTWAFALDASATRARRNEMMVDGSWWSALSDTMDRAPAVPFTGPATGEATLVVQDVYGPGELWLLRADGGGTATAPEGTRDLRWQVQDGDLSVSYAQPRLDYTTWAPDPQTQEMLRVNVETTGLRLRLVSGRQLAVSSRLQRQTVSEGPRSGEVLLAAQAEPWQPASVATALDAYPVEAADLAPGTRWAGAVLRAPSSSFDGLAADVLQVESATRARLELAGVERTLSVADGSFSLKDNTGAEWRYTRLRPATADGLESWLVQGRIGTPTAWAAVVPIAPLAKRYTPTAADLARAWDFDPDGAYGRWRITLQADGTASVYDAAGRWTLQTDGQAHIVRPDSGGYEQVIQWWPLALADGRMVVLQNEQYLPTGEVPASDAAVTRYRTLTVVEAAPPAP
ncbi:Ig-like domain-containing protein [Aquincola tertiaricarbonis]|uniref:Ig-like domain-containing protein n=1 Tax=Aquincola tertiaricarbonis TaxID=391953 RepID=UPI00061519B5|nr:Ig-like domain-containing protein [Aquincola tertiaricarbonis]